MRRTVLLMAVMAACLVMASGVALAVSKTGTNGDDVLRGTAQRDTLAGGGGDDLLYGFARRDRLYGDSGADRVRGNSGPDQLFGGQGFDRVFGAAGDDFINVLDERKDVVECGTGFDEVYADPQDQVRRASVGGRCEAVFRAQAAPPQNAGTLGPADLGALPQGTLIEE